MTSPLEHALATASQLFVKQKKEWAEIIVNWETVNRYAVLNQSGDVLGMIAERGGGIWSRIKRLIFRSHRGFDVDVVDQAGEQLLHLSRSFFFFFSDLWVKDKVGVLQGSIHRRFGIIYKRYDFRDAHGRTFARVASPFWRLWSFPIRDEQGQQQGLITKKWGGALREVFTDADTYMIEYTHHKWTKAQRVVVLAAAISIDFDFFEENGGVRGIFSFMD